MVDRVMSVRARDRHQKQLHEDLRPMNQVQLRRFLAMWMADMSAFARDSHDRLLALESRAATGSCSVLSATDDWACC